MEKIKEFDYAVKGVYSDEIEESTKRDFIEVQKKVFGEKGIDPNIFKKKYIENIYGPSIIVVAYFDEKPVAARSFWRNDLNNQESYQPCDTAVLDKWRGKGLFKLMTKHAMGMLGNDSLLYNYPNSKSYPQYLKLGWKHYKSYYQNILLSFRSYMKKHPIKVDDEYVSWWLSNNGIKHYCYYHQKSVYLVKKMRRSNMYLLIGEINCELAERFDELTCKFPIFFYLDERKTIYNKKKKPLNVVIKETSTQKNLNIPPWKMDVT